MFVLRVQKRLVSCEDFLWVKWDKDISDREHGWAGTEGPSCLFHSITFIPESLRMFLLLIHVTCRRGSMEDSVEGRDGKRGVYSRKVGSFD